MWIESNRAKIKILKKGKKMNNKKLVHCKYCKFDDCGFCSKNEYKNSNDNAYKCENFKFDKNKEGNRNEI